MNFLIIFVEIFLYFIFWRSLFSLNRLIKVFIERCCMFYILDKSVKYF